MVVCALAALGAVASTGVPDRPADQQNQPPTFRARVDLVEIDLVATDAAGRRVLDLQKDELQVLEGGKLRENASLALVNLPLPAPHPPYAQDVASNTATDNGRLFFLILDDVHTLRERSDAVKAVARRFVERLSPGDQVAVAWVGLGNAGAREFTTNHAALAAAIDRFSATGSRIARRNPTDSPLPEFSGLDDRPPDAARDLAALNVRRVFDRSRPFMMVNDVCSYLASLPHRRKAVVFVGTGPGGMNMDELNGSPSRDVLDFTRAMTAAWRANVAVYMLDPGTVLRPDAKPGPDRVLPPNATLQEVANAAGGSGLVMLSLATGGLAERGPAALAAADRVVSDTGTYYLLAYYAEPATGQAIDKLKGIFDPLNGFRSIEVRTTRPGVSIRARKGYWASQPAAATADKEPSRRASDAAGASVAGVLPKSALALRAFVVPLRGRTPSRPDIAVVVEVTLPPLAPATLGLPLADDIEMVITAVAPGQSVRARDRAKVRLNLGEATEGGLVSPRYRLCAPVAVAPGHYQVRVGVWSGLAGRAGSVYADVTVPAFSREPLSLGGLVLERRGPHVSLPTARTKAFAALVPFEPTLDRDFESSDILWARVAGTAGRPRLAGRSSAPRSRGCRMARWSGPPVSQRRPKPLVARTESNTRCSSRCTRSRRVPTVFGSPPEAKATSSRLVRSTSRSTRARARRP